MAELFTEEQIRAAGEKLNEAIAPEMRQAVGELTHENGLLRLIIMAQITTLKPAAGDLIIVKTKDLPVEDAQRMLEEVGKLLPDNICVLTSDQFGLDIMAEDDVLRAWNAKRAQRQ